MRYLLAVLFILAIVALLTAAQPVESAYNWIMEVANALQ